MDAVGREEQGEEDDLQAGEGDVGRDQEGRGGTRDEDGLPQVLEKLRHCVGLTDQVGDIVIYQSGWCCGSVVAVLVSVLLLAWPQLDVLLCCGAESRSTGGQVQRQSSVFG